MPDRLYIVGDIHGCARELDALLTGLDIGPGDTLAFIGDYIDRGADSRAVVDLLLETKTRPGLRTIFLRGNHEDMCLAYLGHGGHWGESWRMNGGGATLRSYGVPATLEGAAAAERFPPEHLAFFEGLALTAVVDGLLLVHAGIRPSVPLDAQDPEDLLWIREEFIASPHELPHTVVFGHTPQRHVLVDLPYKIGIDTGCVYGGRLTALEPSAGMVHQVAYGDRQVRRSSFPRAHVARE
jgi:diadenosine tetraphosphatase ApaH/serine/threonine PP2A family protein phosphatase